MNTTENMNATLYFWGPNPEECLEEELTDAPSNTDDENPEIDPDLDLNDSLNFTNFSFLYSFLTL